MKYIMMLVNIALVSNGALASALMKRAEFAGQGVSNGALASSLMKRAEFAGQGTFYYPNGGYGACGKRLQNYDAICALSFAQIESVPCGSCIRVTGPKGQVVVKVEDKCAGCNINDIDMSYGAFLRVADEWQGRVAITSVVVDCGSGLSLGNPVQQTATTTPPPPPQQQVVPKQASLPPPPKAAPPKQPTPPAPKQSTAKSSPSLPPSANPNPVVAGYAFIRGKKIVARPKSSNKGRAKSYDVGGRCQQANDCPFQMCCSIFGYCGVGPAYCSG